MISPELKNVAAAALALAGLVASGRAGDYPYRAVEMTNVTVTAGFWLPRFETNRLVTVRSNFGKCEFTRIPNFTNAACRAKGKFRGIPFDDSDVYKVIEGAAYALSTHPDPKLEKYLDGLIGWIARAQEPDGYLYTARTLGYRKRDSGSRENFGIMGPTRWSNCGSSHELYNAGHMYEAAVAYFEVTGKRTLLDVAIRNADLVDRTFGPGPGQLKFVPGHEEIELALCKLYRATGEERYLKLAKHFLDQRGRGEGKGGRKDMVFRQDGSTAVDSQMTMPGAYLQAHMPVLEQREAVGHAVRAGYLYCGMADVAALTGDASYLRAIDALWEDVVTKKLHLNGSVGARHHGEAFGAAYELPNETAYLETCAGIANALWNQRLFLAHGDAKYVDVLERVIYNGVLSGVSLDGDRFFYPNPMASKGNCRRSKWFGCSCCPVNVVRFIPQVAQFAYATRGDAAYVNLFMASDARLKLAGGEVRLSQSTQYPWEGLSRVKVTPGKDGQRFALNVRIPGWCVGRPVPSDLYAQVVPGTSADFSVTVNGADVDTTMEKGYCVIDRAWKAGDEVAVRMNMPVRRIRAHANVAADRGRLAVERGPVLYCAEGVDNGGRVLNKAIAPDAVLAPTTVDVLGTAFPALDVPATAVRRGIKSYGEKPCTLRLVPYFAWCHRGRGEMQTFFPVSAGDVARGDVSLDVSASHCFRNDTELAVCDGIEPKSSADQSLPRLTFWPQRGTEEWVAYDLPEPEEAGGVDVYWYDDGGGCRIPSGWKVQVRETDGAPWRDVTPLQTASKDCYNSVDFAPVRAKGIRLVARLSSKSSAGVLEWRVRAAGSSTGN